MSEAGRRRSPPTVERGEGPGPAALHPGTWLALALVVLVTAALRLRLLDVPFERDEGGYAYNASLLLQGVPPFREAFDVKMPGLYALYAAFLALFGESPRGVHIGLLVTNAVTVVCVFLVGRRLAGAAAGLTAALLFGLASISQTVDGFVANTELLLLAPAMAAMALLLRAVERNRPGLFLVCGLLLGAAFLVKHHAVFFALSAGLYVVWEHWSRHPRPALRRLAVRCALLVAGTLLPFLLQTAIMAASGVFEAYWFWLFEYPRLYATAVPLSTGAGYLAERLTAMAPSLGVTAGLALFGLAATAWHRPSRRAAGFLIPFTALSALAVCPTLLFMRHYMVLLLPAATLLAGVGVQALATLPAGTSLPGLRRAARPAALLLAVAAAAVPLVVERAYLLWDSPATVLRSSFATNPFPESVPVARYIADHSTPEDTVAILGSEPQILFYARRRSASPYIYVYPLVRRHDLAEAMQREMVADIERAEPRFVVVVRVPWSWSMVEDAPDLLFGWLEAYLPAHYRRVGLVEILSPTETSYLWDEAVEGRRPRTPFWLEVYSREDG